MVMFQSVQTQPPTRGTIKILTIMGGIKILTIREGIKIITIREGIKITKNRKRTKSQVPYVYLLWLHIISGA